ncbi:unnamed protein product [Phytophthora lilii]|uniref:Unnamed protein product n=1 Tax=Phytophthora lilii TaxID=2077276 RepID=A0A9W6X9L8_9STRA|nr:unnamed protein product [Phytophthora lilii]
MYRELTISSDEPAPKLTKAFKTGKLSLTADQLKGSGSVIHLHPASYEKVIRHARQVVVFVLISHDTRSKGIQAGPRRLSTALGAPQAAIPARAAIRSMTGIGVYDSDSDVDKEDGRVSVADVKKAAKCYAKRKRVLTDVVDAGERYLLPRQPNQNMNISSSLSVAKSVVAMVSV